MQRPGINRIILSYWWERAHRPRVTGSIGSRASRRVLENSPSAVPLLHHSQAPARVFHVLIVVTEVLPGTGPADPRKSYGADGLEVEEGSRPQSRSARCQCTVVVFSADALDATWISKPRSAKEEMACRAIKPEEPVSRTLFHGMKSGYPWSLFEIVRSPGGHSMANAESSHRTPRAYSGAWNSDI